MKTVLGLLLAATLSGPSGIADRGPWYSSLVTWLTAAISSGDTLGASEEDSTEGGSLSDQGVIIDPWS